MTEYRNPIPMTDALAEYHDGTKDGLLLIERDRPPYEGKIGLPGGFSEEGITFSMNAVKELFEEAGARFVPAFLWDVRSDPTRDTRGHRPTIIYFGRAYGKINFGSDARGARGYGCPELVSMLGTGAFAFDHEEVIREYLVYKGYLEEGKKYGTVGAIGRFRPLHAGSATLLEDICDQSQRAVIGIGSANMPLSSRNPWSAGEVADLVDAHLSKKFSNYEIVLLDDYGHIPQYRDGQRWKQEVVEKMDVDSIVSGNKWVQNLLSDTYNLLNPESIIPEERQIHIRGSYVRQLMAVDNSWKSFVPPGVIDYISDNKLDERLRKQFGADILTSKKKTVDSVDSATEEQRRIAQDT